MLYYLSMSKTINTIKYGLIYTLILLAILFLGAITIMAKDANANETATYQPYNQSWTTNNTNASNPLPVVDSINPSSGNLGSGAKTVTISGSGFVPGSIARWNGSNRNTAFIDSSHLIIYLNAGDMYGASGRYITVWSPAPGGGYSNAVLFTINGYVAGSTATNPGSPVQNNNTSNSNSNGNVLGTQSTNQPNNEDDYRSLTSNVLYGTNTFMPSGLVQWLIFAIFVLLIIIVVRKIFFADKYHSTPLKH